MPPTSCISAVNSSISKECYYTKHLTDSDGLDKEWSTRQFHQPIFIDGENAMAVKDLAN